MAKVNKYFRNMICKNNILIKNQIVNCITNDPKNQGLYDYDPTESPLPHEMQSLEDKKYNVMVGNDADSVSYSLIPLNIFNAKWFEILSLFEHSDVFKMYTRLLPYNWKMHT